MANWGFLTKHAGAMLCIAADPGVRLRDIATTLNITERRAYTIVTDLADAGYVVKVKDGRRNRYEVQAQRPLPDSRAEEGRSATCWTCLGARTHIGHGGEQPARAGEAASVQGA